MDFDTSGTLLQKSLTSLSEMIEVWEAQNRLTISHAFVGDASGGKLIQPGHVKMLAIARVSQQTLEASEPIGVGDKFTVQNQMADMKVEIPIIGTIKDGALEFLVSEGERKEYFTDVGRVEEVRFFDVVGEEEAKLREAARKAKKAAKRARQREKKGVEDGKNWEYDL